MSTSNTPSTKPSISLVCARSGLRLGDFQPADYSSLGTSPFVAQWKKTSFLHPVFNLSFSDVCRKAVACWMLEKQGDKRYTMQYKQLLMLALLHSSGCIKQDIPALPTPKAVELHFAKLIDIMSWKLDVDSERLQLPRFHVWYGARGENGSDPFVTLDAWVAACETVREEYETVTRTKKAAAKEKARALALRSIRASLYTDISLRRLWNWLEAQVDSMEMSNNAELESLFFCADSNISAWELEDIQALEDLFIANCELGNSISYEVQKRISYLRSQREAYADAFEIVTTGNEFPEWKGLPKPERKSFQTSAEFAIACARWSLANKPAVSASATTDSEEL